ncbi:MAG: diguanylate cyclase [Desulfobacteraceae bacterium]|nr:diguanylate cyclase [Desulfobacteraceae bacterium]
MSAAQAQNLAVASDCFPSYEVDAVIFYGDPTRIYRARRRSNGVPVMLKTLRDERAAREAAAWLKHEFEVTRRINAPSVIQVYDLERHNNLPVMVLEDFGGDSLDNLARQRRFPLEELLQIAIQLTQGLIDIHAANIIHKDINPSNIVYNPATGLAKIIDFGISTYLTREQAALASPQVFEGSLPYISPEQTGRMNRSIDYRTDFYSLGVTLYELLTGRPLFIVSEPIEWFHCHIAKQPVAPVDINPIIPRPISDIVMKLLAKTAEDRYQSAQGIRADLQYCLDQLRRTGDIAPFKLASHDISDRFQIPQRLYGRENEVAQLLSAFDDVGRGTTKMILVSGYSGIGKTCLIKEIYKPITERHGHFVAGKFDQLHRSTPYSALAAALRDLVRQLLTEPEEELARWRTKIMEAVGANGQLMIDIIHELELIIGPQPPVAASSPIETEQRFHLIFQRFIQVFCGPEHPLAIFLDDLQWVDSASMRLLDILTSGDSGATHLLLIGAYRDNEVIASHPVALWLKELRAREVALEEIRLRPLGREHLTDLLADTLGAERSGVTELSEIVEQKTAGNPFFTEEFLKTLHQQELITFARDKGHWSWDAERIRAQQMTDNVVELMTAKLRQLSHETRQLLELGACVGFRFPLNVLAVVSEEKPAVVAHRLNEAISLGLVAPIGDAYQLLELEQAPDTPEVTVDFAFAHDRIQQAAYSLLEGQRRSEAHLKIGRLLLNHLSPMEQKERLFEITDHLNLGSGLVDDLDERAAMCRLNLEAGKRAKNSNAYQPAFDYLQIAFLLIDGHIWQDNYPLALELYSEAAEAAYLTGRYDTMDNLLTAGLEHAKDILDKVKLYQVMISACMARGRLLEAINIAKKVLARLGHHYPEKPTQLHVILKLIQLQRHLRGKNTDYLLNRPAMTEPKHLAAMKIGGSIGGAAMFAQPTLLPLLILHGLKTSIIHGYAPESLGTFAAYGAILAEALGKADQGMTFGQLALDLAQRHQVKNFEGRLHHVYNSMVRHWKEPLRNCLEPLHEAFRLCLEHGDFEYAAHAVCVRLGYAYEVGTDLKHLLGEIHEYLAIMKPLKQGPRVEYLENYLQKIDCLLGNASDPAKLKGRYYDIDQMMPMHEQSGDKSLAITDRLNQVQLSYLFGRHVEALAMAGKRSLANTGSGLRGMYFSLPYCLLDSLVRLANVPGAAKKDRKQLLRQVAANHAKLKRWAKINPVNGLNKLRLVEAERLRIIGRDFEAHRRYDEAIRLARENEFIQEEALAYELCGLMHLNAERDTLGQPYLAKARDLYRHWGAQAKVNDMERRYPWLIEKIARKGGGKTTSIATPLVGIDIGSLMKALKAIAAEKIHSRMVETIITTAMEFAGAQLGLLILRNPSGELCIEAEASVDGGEPRILQSIPVSAGRLPLAVINYVSRTRSSIVIQDAQKPNNQIPGLDQDSHVLAQGVRSMLCMPILTGSQEQSELIGMLYMENNLASATFTQERFDTLEIICLAAAGRLELSRKAVIDGLTELYNHDYFQNLLSQEFASARRHGRELAMVLIDIDHFKKFNDTWGHQVGDKVLREVAQIIKTSCRSGDTVARYGGEEMAVILPMANRDSGELVAERIRAAVESHRVAHNSEQLKVTISLGLATLDASIPDKESLIRRADTALYRSKAEGRNRLTIA